MGCCGNLVFFLFTDSFASSSAVAILHECVAAADGRLFSSLLSQALYPTTLNFSGSLSAIQWGPLPPR